MPKIDAHQHFWIFDPVRDSWINDEMLVIKQDFLPADLLPVLQQNGIDGCVAVQASQSEEETLFLLKQAVGNDFVKGVVGWVDLKADDLEARLEYFKQYDKLKGFRHILQSEPDKQFMLQSEFKKGIASLQKHGYTYDILIYPEHLPYAGQLVKTFPDQPFVVDHLAKPHIKDQDITEWRRDIEALAMHENVHCKISGMLTEANWTAWKITDFTPYLDVVFNAFGSSRIMFGSDWPVCLLAGGYEGTMQVVNEYTSKLSATEQELFWGDNATVFYDL
ncbi:amidohydrolase family protein [Mucilaginibacter aquaedulcis]|uniref:amidohydrolase family protein n=1 Tax=Mucilaginibacter aquaedulcis TaxID=1187081 RepID=UPI0025B6082E|nr:amidohydrolase family protein [Mucilaginibacter aquaedulcis]MDN3549405.1 amidohydrolase family protein [Mucilaginibacter aquaedulcis]